jgi:hypothetical protein
MQRAHLMVLCCGGTAARAVRGAQCKQSRCLGISIVCGAVAAHRALFKKAMDLLRASKFTAAVRSRRAVVDEFARERRVAKQDLRAPLLADVGTRAGREHCKGALACCSLCGFGCVEDAVLALRMRATWRALLRAAVTEFILDKVRRNGFAGLKHNLVRGGGV